MIRKLALGTALAAALATAPAFAQTPQASSNNKVIIEAQRPEEAVRDFVAEIGEGAKADGANLARWDRKVCVGVVNITQAYAQRLIDQVSLVAAAVGLEPGEPGCRPNVLVLADSKSDELAARLIKDSPKAFRPEFNGTSNLGRSALRKFEKSNAPVRWWHVSQTVLADTGASAMEGRSVRVRGASRLRNNVREDLQHAIIILDTSRIGSVSFASLADYVAMVALAQVDADADMREFPSILNLFTTEKGDRTARMTQWDLDYLIALYDTPGDTSSAKREARHIARAMMKRPSDTKAATE